MDFLITTITDSIKSEATSINLVFDDKTGKVSRIINTGKVTERRILIRFRHEQILAPNWTREYLITPDKDGEDRTTIDIPMTVKDFYLVKDKDGVWKTGSNIEITISDTPIEK